MSNELWYHGLYGISRDVHPTARVKITPGTDGKFIMEYLTTDGWRIRIIGQSYVNVSVQFTGIPGGCGSSLPYIPKATIPYTNR